MIVTEKLLGNDSIEKLSRCGIDSREIKYLVLTVTEKLLTNDSNRETIW